MENTQITIEEKLGFFNLLNKALTLPLKNPHFILFSIIASAPLFCFTFTSETIFQKAFIETAKIISEAPPPPLECFHCFGITFLAVFRRGLVLGLVKKLLERASFTYLLMVIFSQVILNFLDFIAATAIVDSSSLIFEAKSTMNLKHMLQRLAKETRFKGPLITSITVFLLASLFAFGLFSLATYAIVSSLFGFPMALFGFLLVPLSAKFIEWSAIWNMGIVISVVEEKRQGDVALFIASYLSRGNRKHGFLLALVFFIWMVVLRVSCLYLRSLVGGSGMVILAAYASLVCFGNVMKWVVFVAYYYNCKRRGQEKSGVVEESHAIA